MLWLFRNRLGGGKRQMSALITRDNKTWEKQDTPELLNELEKRLKKDFGKHTSKGSEFVWECPTCGAWLALSILRSLYEV